MLESPGAEGGGEGSGGWINHTPSPPHHPQQYPRNQQPSIFFSKNTSSLREGCLAISSREYFLVERVGNREMRGGFWERGVLKVDHSIEYGYVTLRHK